MMGCPVAELQQRISSEEFTRWLAYYQIEPWGDERADLRNAMLCAIIANQWRKRRAPFKVKDFMLQFGPQQKRKSQSPEEAREVLMKFTEYLRRVHA